MKLAEIFNILSAALADIDRGDAGKARLPIPPKAG